MTGKQAQTPTKEQLQIARSVFLDSFAEVEKALIALQARLDPVAAGKSHKGCVGSRLDSLRAIKASAQFSKTRVATVRTLVDRIDLLNNLRCDVVHSRMSVAPIAGETRACFINVQDAVTEFPSARLVTLAQFNALSKELGAIAASLDKA